MAWMRMMGADSVAYHEATVARPGDDFAGRARAYYGSRGETPLVWGGSGAERLGLVEAVTPHAYRAIYGPGGALDPVTRQRLVKALRPGMELVVSAHKSVAMLGVIGRADDMHRILDAERDATLGHLERLTIARGGRRGREAIPTRTSGLTYAVTRHLTSRAGDPLPHDHVLLANVVEMLDERGGWKAADTRLWRDHLHEATMVGRLAAARTAVELGYGIRLDAGATGRLGHWAIAGVPEAAMAALSKRTGEIAAAAGGGGWRARQIAARTTRKAKRREPPSRLLPSWQAELAAAGHPVEDIKAGIAAARTARILEPLDGRPPPDDVDAVVDKLIHAGGPLAARKAWRTSDLVVAAAPLLYGRELSVLEHVVRAVLGRSEVLPLLGHADRERTYTLASTVAVEHAIAELAELCRGPSLSPAIPTDAAAEAIGGLEERTGHRLTAGQADTVRHLCGSRRRLEIVIGHAGTGKTTALAAVRTAYEGVGWTVLGTSTSGQAARALKAEADVPSRTLASLRWQAEHGRIRFGRKTAIILDEAGMADDPDLLWLLGQVATAGGRLIMVGDHRQLDAVGPGGGLRAIIDRGEAHHLDEVVRQVDPAERRAVAEVRDGDPALATNFYAATTASTRSRRGRQPSRRLPTPGPATWTKARTRSSWPGGAPMSTG